MKRIHCSGLMSAFLGAIALIAIPVAADAQSEAEIGKKLDEYAAYTCDDPETIFPQKCADIITALKIMLKLAVPQPVGDGLDYSRLVADPGESVCVGGRLQKCLPSGWEDKVSQCPADAIEMPLLPGCPDRSGNKGFVEVNSAVEKYNLFDCGDQPDYHEYCRDKRAQLRWLLELE